MFRTHLAALGPMAATLFAAAAVAVISGTGCSATGVGDPCIPEQEYQANFAGFDEHEVNVESKSFQCETRLCLVNHFRGRVSCPYGQDPTASHADGTTSGGEKCNNMRPGDPNSACCTPGIYQPVCPAGSDANGNCLPSGGGTGGGDAGAPATSTTQEVKAQCTDRKAAATVYCSCRCANVQGKTDDGANYCTCPDGYDCTQLVSQTGVAGENLTGAYCVKHNTQYNPNANCADFCTPGGPGAENCGPTNTAQQ